MEHYFLGVDVGTGSARAGLFDSNGALFASAKHDIRIWKEPGEVVEQSSEDIWAAVCVCVRQAVAAAGVRPDQVAGIGFDATCSLAALGPGGAPMPVGLHGDPARNIIVWMDHRATGQAGRINRIGGNVLKYVGGIISPEMETPKLLWLAENMPETFRSAWQFMDLTDFLTWRATGSLARSMCTVTCKWTYLAHESRWDETYFRSIELGALADEGFRRIGVDIVPGGTPLGDGLTSQAARELGLTPGAPVGAGLIDAHAGGVGSVGGRGGAGDATTRMAYVFGTSACTMSSSRDTVFVPGVWGPYWSAMVPGLWLNEGGQSAAGAAIDHLIQMHPAAPAASRLAADAGESLSGWLARRAESAGGAAAVERLLGALHVVPEFLGNRAPFADPHARAIIAGVGLDSDVDSLVGLYLAGLCGIGYGARQILESQRNRGIRTETIVVSGGASQTPLVRQLLADATGLAVAATKTPEPVLLGSAILGSVAARHYDSVEAAMEKMSELGEAHQPTRETAAWHAERFSAFERLQEVGRELRGVGRVPRISAA
jgi:D-ribulokinase